MTNQVEKADSFAQMSMYLHLLLLIGDGIQFLGIHMQEREICDETISRLEQVIELYHMDKIHPNVVASFLCQSAAYFCRSRQRAVTYASILSPSAFGNEQKSQYRHLLRQNGLCK